MKSQLDRYISGVFDVRLEGKEGMGREEEKETTSSPRSV